MTMTMARIEIGSVVIEVECGLASHAGWMVLGDGSTRDESGYAYARLAQALSEYNGSVDLSKVGQRALLRAIAIGEERSFASRQSSAMKEAAMITLQAAQVGLQTARIEFDTAQMSNGSREKGR